MMSGAAEQASDGVRTNVTTVLIVDDAAIDRRMTGAIIEENLGWHVEYAEDGVTALAAMQRHTPRMVLTDMRMPVMNGLELVAAIRQQYPDVPVILMTAFGNEEIAMQALREGASSYVPKKMLDEHLVSTLEQVLASATQQGRQQQLLSQLSEIESTFLLENDRAIIPALIVHVQEYLSHMEVCDPTERIRVGIALEESLLNAIFHGNLEISSELRQDDERNYYKLAEERRLQSPYQDRKAHFTFRVTHDEVRCIVQDEGPGFDPSKLPDPTDPENLGRVGGRGLLLIRTFMDEVKFNDKGNEITLIKRCSPTCKTGS